jgi:hypothetical protein
VKSFSPFSNVAWGWVVNSNTSAGGTSVGSGPFAGGVGPGLEMTVGEVALMMADRKFGRVPIHWAAAVGSLEIVKYVIFFFFFFFFFFFCIVVRHQLSTYVTSR